MRRSSSHHPCPRIPPIPGLGDVQYWTNRDATRDREILLACESDARGRAGLESQPYPQRDYLLRAREGDPLRLGSSLERVVSEVDRQDQFSIRPIIAHLANPESLTNLLHAFRKEAESTPPADSSAAGSGS